MKHIIKLLCISSIFIFKVAFAAPLTIKFATEATYPPFEFVTASGEIKGFDIAIAQALCQKMTAQCTFSNQPWDSLIPSLQLGKFDALIGAINITSSREKQVGFTDPYYLNTASFVTVTGSHLDISPPGLKNKTIGVQQGTTLAQYLQGTYGNAVKVNTYASEEDAFLDLTSGRIDAVFGDTPLVEQWIQQNGNKYQITGNPVASEQYFGNGYGIAVKKGNANLAEAFNKALAAIKSNGVYAKIKEQYLGNY